MDIDFRTVKFPHLLPGEVTVWKSFLWSYADTQDRYIYDVHVGEGSLPQENQRTVYGDNFGWLTKKRIDVVGWRGSIPTIYEVRNRFTIPLMGQLIGYKYLWMRQNPESIPPMMIGVCTFCQPDDLDVCRAHDVRVVVVPEWDDVLQKPKGV